MVGRSVGQSVGSVVNFQAYFWSFLKSFLKVVYLELMTTESQLTEVLFIPHFTFTKKGNDLLSRIQSYDCIWQITERMNEIFYVLLLLMKPVNKRLPFFLL